MANKLHFTKAAIEMLPIPTRGGRAEYWDAKQNGLQVRVTSNGIKSFYVRRRVAGGGVERIFLGRVENLSIEQARKKAAEIVAEITLGKNPADIKRLKKTEMTLGEIFNEYIEKLAKARGKKTVKDMQENFRRYLMHWKDKKISTISKLDVSGLHTKLGNDIGHHTANRTLELLRAVINKGIQWGLIAIPNPALGVEKYKLISRERFIHGDELPRFFQALSEEPNSTMRDYFLLSLLTGARQSNVLSMRWKDINFERCEWYIEETKNGTPHTVTLSPEAINILEKRTGNNSEFVFQTDRKSKLGHIQNPKKAWKKLLIRGDLENLRIHDLRRTLGSWQAKTGASLAIIGKSLNHKNQSTTQIYARLDLDPVRESVNIATKAIFDAAKKK